MTNQDWLERSLRSVWHPCTQMKHHEHIPMVPIERGEGVWLYDFNGKRYLDAVSSWWVNLFGHNNPKIKHAIKTQLDVLDHVMLAGFTHKPVIQCSEKLSKITGLGHCFYASDGASAVEIALKMSFHYWRNQGKAEKTQFICLRNSYHGETVGALSVTDIALFKDAYGPLLRPAQHMSTPDSRLAEFGESEYDFALRCAAELESYVSQHHASLSALVIEPMIQCATGMAMYDAVYLKRAREICDQYQVHLIADEIAVGFGRTGMMFGCDHAQIRPDFMCLSKGLTGGVLPLSVVLTTDAVYQAFYDDSIARGFLHSHSYTGNPLACSAALATLSIFEDENVLESNRIRTKYINHKLTALANLPILHLRNLGMVWAFEVATDVPDFSKNCYQMALAHGLLIRPIGNTIYLMPPYSISKDEMTWLVDTLVNVLKKCLKP